MKTDWTALEPFRLTDGQLASSAGNHFGFFIFGYKNKQVRAMACDAEETGWEHVSVSVMLRESKSTRMPTWDEMCEIKDRFWDDEEAVVQFHPPKSKHVNNHQHYLQLWKCVRQDQPLPPSILVGLKELGTLT